MVVPASTATFLPHRSWAAWMLAGLPFWTRNAWPAWKYGIMSTCARRSGVDVLRADDDVALAAGQRRDDRVEERVHDLRVQPEASRNALCDLDVRSDRVAVGVEVLLRRIGQV